MNYMNMGFVALLIVGAVLAGVLTLILRPGSSKQPETVYKGKVMYFAIHLGDGLDPPSHDLDTNEEFRAKKCGFRMNVDNTRDSIRAMEGAPIRYSFIKYNAEAETTPPLEAGDALRKLYELKSNSNRVFNQTAAIMEFKKQVGERASDLLVHYIPCRFNYSATGDDTRNFVKEMENFRGRIMLASNTNPAADVAKAFNQSPENVIGNDDEVDISDRIKRFGTRDPVTSISTTTTPNTSPSSAPPEPSTVNGTQSTSTKVLSSTTGTASPTEASTSGPHSQETTKMSSAETQTSPGPTDPVVQSTTGPVSQGPSTQESSPTTAKPLPTGETSAATETPASTTKESSASTGATEPTAASSGTTVPVVPTTKEVNTETPASTTQEIPTTHDAASSTTEAATSPDATKSTTQPSPTTESVKPPTNEPSATPEASTTSSKPDTTTQDAESTTKESPSTEQVESSTGKILATTTTDAPPTEPSGTTKEVETEPPTPEAITSTSADMTSPKVESSTTPGVETTQSEAQATTTKPTTNTTSAPAKKATHCLFAADLLNFGTDSAAYEKVCSKISVCIKTLWVLSNGSLPLAQAQLMWITDLKLPSSRVLRNLSCIVTPNYWEKGRVATDWTHFCSLIPPQCYCRTSFAGQTGGQN
ncbi:hypothetical protein Y032_0193g1410 [Ancylostoma ceylanicum]|nr:hypothetical protein Y032_0193g1410 [Ancylostoma ceylanicum]